MANHNHQIEFDDELSHTENNRMINHTINNNNNTLDSNNNSAQTVNQNLAAQDQPKIGLKLVLRRQSNNNYEITNTSVNTTSLSSSSSSSTTVTSTAALNISTRPKREASRKVKFRFSDSEYEIDTPKPKKVKTSRTSSSSSSSTSITNTLPQVINTNTTTTTTTTKFKQAVNQPLVQSRPTTSPKLETKFSSSEVVHASNEEKLKIYESQPLVLIEHSRPFPICLVEDKTDIVCTKAVLFIHLFQTYTAPCIGCPLCKSYLNITEFSKHIHPEDDESDDDDDDDGRKRTRDDFDDSGDVSPKPAKSYKILPYCLSGDLSEADLKIWKLFSQRVSLFKQTANKLKSHVNSKQQKVEVEKEEEEERSINNKENIEPPKNKTPAKENQEFNRWDYVNTTDKLYVLTDHSINSDQIVYLNKNGDNYNKDVINNNVGRQNGYKRQLSDDLNLSEDEEEANQPQQTHQVVKSPQASKALDEPMGKKIRREPLASVENKHDEQLIRPSRDELYYNMYENSSKDKLFYIVDNQYTIIPDSYIYYVNKKREHYFQQLKLARSNYFQKKWLNLSLDLEFKIN